MAAFKKHVGKDKNGTRLVVVYREIPGAEDHCLCVQSDSLMEMYHDQLLREVDSRDAQATVNLYEVLERRHFGDGQQMLNGLHQMGKLHKYKVADITMLPMPNRPVPLAIVNAQIKGGDTAALEAANVKAEDVIPEAPVSEGVSVDTDAGLVQNQVNPVSVTPVAIGEGEEAKKAAAESKLLQARLMEEDAKKMRQEAYTLDPSLKKGGRPSKKQAEKIAEAKED